MRRGVFVCHASQDAGSAQRAVEALEAGGVGCWIAPRDIDPGENYTQAILDALDAAPAIVLVFSSATNESPHVSRELEIAVGAGRSIVPVRLEDGRALGFAALLHRHRAVAGRHRHRGDWSEALVPAVRRVLGQPDDRCDDAARRPGTPAGSHAGARDPRGCAAPWSAAASWRP